MTNSSKQHLQVRMQLADSCAEDADQGCSADREVTVVSSQLCSAVTWPA